MPHFALKSPCCRRHPGSPNAGFALLITIVLMAILVLIMVSFSALTRVEIQIAKNYQEQDAARQNALVALNIALGQLQKYAGPDQRTTATADLAAGADTYADADGQTLSRGETYGSTETAAPSNATVNNGLVRPKAGARHWTGVWGNQNDPLSAYTTNPAPKLLTWLVSGNENAAFTFDQSASTNFGQINSVTTAPTFTPATLSGVTAATDATSTSVTFANGAKGVLLVGPKSTGTVGTSRTKHSTTAAVDLAAEDSYVAAPLVAINAPAGSVPGLGATATPPLGNYAWWVGDEGVKARINLSDTNTDLANSNYLNGLSSATTAGDPAGRQRYAGPARNAIELITGLSALATPNTDNSFLNKVLQTVQLNFVPPGGTTSALLATTKARFHDITTYSSGVLSDSLRGGLRQDLTYVLSQTSLPTAFSTQPLLNEAGANAPAFGPTWQKVKSHWDLGSAPGFTAVANNNFGRYEVRIGSKDAVHITPIITKLRFVGTSAILRQSNGTYQLNAYGGVYLVLGNPYVNNLLLPDNVYDLRLRRSAGNTGVLSIRVTINHGTTGASVGTYTIDLLNGTNATDDNWNFRMGSSTIGRSLDAGGDHNYRSQDFFSVGSNLRTNFSGTVDVLGYMRDPYVLNTAPKGSGLKAFTSTLAVTVPAPTAGVTYKVNMELVNTGNLAFDATLVEASAPNRVLTGIYNCALPVEAMQLAGDVNWVGAATTPDFKPSMDSAAVLNADGTLTPNPNPPAGLVPGAVAGGFTLVLNAPANTNFFGDPAGLAYQGTADSNRMAASFTDAGGASGPAAVFGYHGGFKIPDKNSSDTSKMQKYFIEPAGTSSSSTSSSSYPYTVNAWGRRSTYSSITTYPVYANLPFAAVNATTGDYPFYSLADLRGVNLSGDDESWSVGHQPTYIFGNGYHNVFVPRAQVKGSMAKRSGGSRAYYDMSYLLNTSLWDRYFFSSLPQSGSSLTPLNRRLVVQGGAIPSAADLRSATAAKHITTTGAFNINSTSPEAWRALLGAMNGVPSVGKLSTGAADLTLPETNGVSFPRYRGEDTSRKATTTDTSTYGWVKGDNSGAVIDGITNTRIGPYTTHHRLTPTELIQLSEDLAREVRKRGPFLSLAQFVNRSLSADDLGRTGALQGALDITRGTPASINSFYTTSTLTGVLQPTTNGPEQQITYSGAGFYAEPLDTTAPFTAGANHRANRLKAMPGWVLQGDVLASLGSVISARSDTFVIRTYGDTQNPVTGTVTARAWCEAVVQRLPDYVNPADSSETLPANLNQADNKKFGRRFVVVSFRWLSPSDI
jgi:Tfp pilus assembly protein PilX